MAEKIKNALKGIMEDPSRPVSPLLVMTEAERRQILEEWNNNEIEFRAFSLQRLLKMQAEASPDSIAVEYALQNPGHDSQKLSYAELNQRANQLARYLLNKGIQSGSVAGLFMERSVHAIVGMIGIVKANSVYLPLDPSAPVERLAFMLKDSGLSFVITQRHLKEKFLESTGGEFPQQNVICIDSDWQAISEEIVTDPELPISANDAAYIIYTSGSTGNPKGVLIDNGAISAHLQVIKEHFQLSSSDRVLQFSAYSFDQSVEQILATLISGAALVLRGADLWTPSEFSKIVEDNDLSVVNIQPAYWRQWSRAAAEHPPRQRKLRLVIIGGDAVLPEDILLWHQTPMRSVRLLNAYGPTETTVTASTFEIPYQPDNQIAFSRVPIGRPLPNRKFYIVDQNNNLVPVGVAGELLIGGESLAHGYVNQPNLTAEKFISNPFVKSADARVYRSGDLARYLEDGNVEFLGRIDSQVKLRGFRIELGEIESALLQHPLVNQSVVVVQNEITGQKHLAAYVVVKENTSANKNELISEIRNYLKQKLPDYMIPWAFMVLNDLPLNASGKIDRKSLPEIDAADLLKSVDFAPAQTPAEQALAEIWAELLGLSQISRNDNFFELGGDSILSLQFISRAQVKGLYLTPRQVFEAQTIEALAEIAGKNKSIEADQGLVFGSAPLTPVQHWFFEHYKINPHHYNQSVLMDAERIVDGNLLTQALGYLLNHHDALRTRFKLTAQGWRQLFVDVQSAESLIHVLDLAALAPAQQQSEMEKTSRELQSTLNINVGPLIRVALFNLGRSQPQKILFIIHHAVIDFVSWQIIISDLWTLYDQLARKQTPQLPDKTTSFKAWSEWLIESAHHENIKRELNYWQEINAEPFQSLPVDYAAPKEISQIADAGSVEVILSAAETQSLLRDVSGVYHTQINDILLTALAQAFFAWTGVSGLLINLEGHGRETDALDLVRTVGWFTSIFPVRLKLPGTDTSAAIKSIKEQLRRIPQKGAGFGALRYLNPETAAQLSNLPQPEVRFNYGGQLKTVSVRGLDDGLIAQEEKLIYLLDINGSMVNDQLVVSWVYSKKNYKRQTIEDLAQGFMRALQNLMTHCQSSQTGGYTPSDFPLSRLSQIELDRLVGRGENIADVYPLSPMQSGMLFHSLYAPDSGDYFIQNIFEVSGNFDKQRFKQAWQQIINRHTIFRSAFVWQGLPEPMQIVYQQVNLPWDELDWRDLSPAEQDSRLAHFLSSERSRGFDLTQTPLASVKLIRLGENRYQFIWQCHHLLTDGWSADAMFKEVFGLYQNPNAPLPSARPYREFIAWLAQQNLEKAAIFWKENLADFSDATSLGVDRDYEDKGYQTYRAEFTEEFSAQLIQFARQHRLTLNTLVQGAYALLLGKYSGESDVLFGVTVNGRPAELTKVEERLGPFINTLPARIHITDETHLLPWLENLQRENVKQNEYAYTPLVEIQRQSAVPAGKPLFESILVFENYPFNEALFSSPSGLQLDRFRIIEQTNYPLLISALPGDRFALSFTFDKSKFDFETVERMAGHYQHLLESMLANPQQHIADFSLLTETERRQIIEEWNDTRVEYPQDVCVQDLFEAQALRTPDAIAAVFEDRSLTYAELNRRANQLAHYLQKRGVKSDALVGVYIERSLEMLVALLGILKAGGAYVPVDPSYPLDRQKYIIKDSGVSILLTQENLREALRFFSGEQICLDSDWSKIAKETDANTQRDVTFENLAYVIYTSGSTGLPKGAMVMHGGLTNYLNWCLRAYPMGGQGSPVHSSLSFDLTVTSIFPALLAGRKVYLLPEKMGVESLELILKEEKDFSLVKITPAHLRLLNEQVNAADVAGRARAFVIGGENLYAEHVNFWMEYAPDTTLINEYGPTETVVGCCVYIIPAGSKPRGVIPIGKPIDNTQLYVLDKYLQPAPIGVAGELYIGGAGVARGYLNQPELTAQRFIPSPFDSNPRARLYKTGDRVRWLPDGNLEFLGRFDFQVKVRGYRIELGEIESVLEQISRVKQAVVTVLADSAGEKRLVAYVVLENSAVGEDLVAELRDHLKQKLPDYMIPAAFVMLNELPLTHNGKVDRNALPKPEVSRKIEGHVEARTSLEKTLAGIWAGVLGIEHVGVEDNFFDLGGHSLLAIRLFARMHEALHLDFSLRMLFEAPTIAQLATQIENIIWAAKQGSQNNLGGDEDARQEIMI